ncbi:MAG: hypothetical protein HUJ11_02905, partial [Arenibacter algicola]|nr:hypothetical protein [Arenibacter algicola]
MPTRIADYASQQILNSYLSKVQRRMQESQVQITSEKRSQDYLGIGYDTQRMVSFEIDTLRLEGYQ